MLNHKGYSKEANQAQDHKFPNQNQIKLVINSAFCLSYESNKQQKPNK